ncbi:MAG: bifunctional precorrin-2 dehydrogenase/sirohydrochlorin ferrochelatase [bacterium]
MPRYYPISIDLENADCLVVGGGAVAERKVQTLLSCGARVTLVSPEVTPRIAEMASTGEITLKRRCYTKGDCRGMWTVIVATDSDETNREVAREAKEGRCLINVVDQPLLSNFIVPATLRRGDLQISISTNGKSPALARRIRERLEGEFGPEYAQFLDLVDGVRERVLAAIPDPEKRREIFYRIVDSDLLQLLKEGKTHEAQRRLEELV